MKRRFAIFLTLLLLSTAVFAHRLNEYLEATTINLSRGKVFIELRLTPGEAVAAEILKGIDLNGDHRISEKEQRAYRSSLDRDLSLMLDGSGILLRPISSSFPGVEAMIKGTGDIIIDYEAKIGQNSSHQLVFKNKHHKPVAVYLVNCLLPADTIIHVTSQTRSADQSVYELDFTIDSVQSAASAAQQQSMKKAEHQAVIKTYFLQGVSHILSGYDHLLFLCALVLGAAGLWNLIKIVTAFTIAHSLTLTLATLGYAHLPEQVVEPVITASIVFVAVQNIGWPNQAKGYNRLAVAFFFGLFHGLGFAGGLLELMHGMPARTVVYAILGFSLGVEAGNQLVLLPLYGTLQMIRQAQIEAANPQRLLIYQRLASGAVAVGGIYYLCIALARHT